MSDLSQRLRDAAALKVGGEEKPDAALLLEAAEALDAVPAVAAHAHTRQTDESEPVTEPDAPKDAA